MSSVYERVVGVILPAFISRHRRSAPAMSLRLPLTSSIVLYVTMPGGGEGGGEGERGREGRERIGWSQNETGDVAVKLNPCTESVVIHVTMP